MRNRSGSPYLGGLVRCKAVDRKGNEIDTGWALIDAMPAGSRDRKTVRIPLGGERLKTVTCELESRSGT